MIDVSERMRVEGHVCGHVPFISDVDLSRYTFGDCNNDDCRLDQTLTPMLDRVYDYISTNYVFPCFPHAKLLNSSAWSGVDGPSSEWHNDAKEGFNSNILVYLDDSMGLNTIEVRTKDEDYKIYPKVGTFVWINQAPQFQHRATHVAGERRVLSYELWI